MPSKYTQVLSKNLISSKRKGPFKIRPVHLWVTTILSFLQICPAQAQTIDYGSLQELFGEPVTTSATGKPQKSSEAPVAMEIITAEQIKRHGVTSIPEILARVTGLTTWQPSRATADVGVRGQNTDYNPTLLVLVNGRQVYNDIYGYTDWPVLPVQLEEIRQIEIVKGPASALYGFNAVSGVVNIVTYNPKYDKVGEAGLTVGTGKYGRAHAIQTAKVSEKVSVRLSSSLERFDEFSAESDTTFGASSVRQNNLNKKIMADGLVTISDKTQLRVEASYVSAENNDSPLTYFLEMSDKIFWSGKTTLTSDTSIGLIEANLYTNTTKNQYAGAYPGSGTNNVTVAQLQDLFKVGTSHTFRVQGEYRHNSVTSASYSGTGADTFYDLVATGGMWNWAITPTIEVTNSARIDHLMLGRTGPFATTAPFTDNSQFDQSITDFSLNNGVVWKATNLDTLRASYARGIQAPSLFQFGLIYPIQAGVVVAGDPNLQPTIVSNYEIGYDRLIEKISGKFRSSLFYKKTEGINSVNGRTYVSGATNVLQVGEIGDSETGGIEIGISGKIGEKWNWDAGYIYQNTTDAFKSSTIALPSLIGFRYEDLVPHHVINAHIGYQNGNWETDIYGEAASNFNVVSNTGLNYNVAEADGYYKLGGRVAYNFENNVTVSLHGSDLAQKSVQDNYGLRNERRVFLSLTKNF